MSNISFKATGNLFTSRRERRLWFWTFVAVITIYSTLGLARTLADLLYTHGLDVGLFVLGCLLVLVAVVTQGLSTRPGMAELGLTLGISAIYLLVFMRMTIPTERSHLVEYGVVAILIYEAFKERKKHRRLKMPPSVSAILFTACVGSVDEGIQKLLPNRIFDWNDILFNVLAAVMAVFTSASLSWVRQRSLPLRDSNS
ncbi:MAG: VanZ family protein [Calditrichaeota bacterium]|nr:MAG: VanZ family protein [Calditrichota bacterium]